MLTPDMFLEVCDQAKPADPCYCSLYVNVPYYGGPEEGGWWGVSTHLLASQGFPCEEDANQAMDRVKELVEAGNRDERRKFGEQCLREMEWLEARGLDSDFFPEPDGESRYWVCVEEKRGEHESRGCRHYE